MSIWTEQDAKVMWCPMTRVGDVNLGGVANRPDNGTNCLASGCMLWRWAPELELELRRKEEPAPEGEGWTLDTPKAEVRTYRRNRKKGFCGLGGQP